MTQQLDMMPGALLDDAVLQRIDAQLPKARPVKGGGLRLQVFLSSRVVDDLKQRILNDARRLDVGHEIVLPERAREDHR